MSNKDAFSSLVGHLGKTRAEGIKLSRLSISKQNTNSTAAHSSGSVKPPVAHDSRPQSLGSAGTAHDGVRFGSPSSNRRGGSQGSTLWMHLLNHAASGGLASAFGGGGSLLSAIGGVGGLVSSIVGLFGGSHKTPLPLPLFTLNTSQNQSLSVSGNSHPSIQAAPPQGGAYGTPGTVLSTSQLDHQPYQFQSGQIAQAVKQALLNSSDLNDVIAEI